MRLKTRFRITTAASLVAVLMLVAVLTSLVLETRRITGKVELAQSLVKEQYERALLRDDYLLSRSARARAQWEEKTVDLPALLANAGAAVDSSAERLLIDQATELIERTAELFREIAQRDDAQLVPAPEGTIGAELRQRSIVALRVQAHDLYARLRQLETLASARLETTQRQAVVALIALLVTVLAVTLINSRMASTTVERRILLLRDGAEQVAAGNFDHRLHIRGDDELADLGRSFDAMTARLQASYQALEVSNRELEAFSYAVSHDLRAPLRSVAGFSQAALEDYGPKLDARGRQYLELASEAAREMGQLIDDLLGLSRVGRAEMALQPVDLSTVAIAVVEELRRTEPGRRVEAEIAPGLVARGDPTLLRLVMENLLRNAWKFTSHHSTARIRVGREPTPTGDAYFVADDGAGFDMAYVDKLFHPFQRLHRSSEFPGTGIGLATVQRILRRHGGEAWAEGAVEKGATIYFTIPGKEETHAGQGHPAR
jgi:signal transduction histidine kinase